MKKPDKNEVVSDIQSFLVLTMTALGCIWTWLTIFRVVGLITLCPLVFIPLSVILGLLSFAGLFQWIYMS